MALNMNNKKSSLDEDAYIYEQRHEDNITEKEKLASMSKKEKRAYFSEYYSKPLIIGIIVLIVVGYMFYHDFIARKNIIYRGAIMNETITSENLTKLNTGFTKYCKLDTSKYETAFNTYYTNQIATLVGATAASDLQTVASQIYASSLDCMITDQDTMKNYLDHKFISSMEDFLTDEEYQKLKPYLYIPKRKDNPDKRAYGIYLEQSSTYQASANDGSVNIKQPIWGVLFNSEEKERSKDMLYYLFPEILGAHTPSSPN